MGNPIAACFKNVDLLSTTGITAIIDDTVNISACNAEFAEFIELPLEKITDKPFEDFIVPQERNKLEVLLENALSGVPSNEYLSFISAGSEKKIGNVSFVPFFEENTISGVYCFIRDVSARIRQNKKTFDNEQRLKTIFENEPECVKITSPDGILIDINPAGLKMIGALRKSDVIGRNIFDIICSDDREKFIQLHHQSCKGKGGTLQFRINALNGEHKWMDSHAAPLRNNEGKVYAILSITRDITESKRAELLLAQNEQRFRALIQNGSDLIGVLNKKGEYQFVSPTVENILGEKSEFYIGKTAFSFIHPDDLAAVKKAMLQIQKDTHTELPLFRFKNHSGYWRWILTKAIDLSDYPGINGIVVNSRDITEIKEAEMRIQRSEQHFKALVSHGSDMIVIVNKQANFLYASENVTCLLGYDPEFLVGKNAFDFIHADDHENALYQLQKLIDKNDPFGVQHRFLNKAGDWVWLESKGVNHLEDAAIEGIVINARDISDRIRLQQKLDEERADKQKQITAAIIETQERERSQLGLELHDNVNQVLTTIKLYNEMLLEGMGDQKDILQRSVKHLQSCINEIRSISKRLSAPTLGKISLEESVKELVSSINLTNRISIKYSVIGLHHISISQDLHLAIYRIIQEHLNNILKYAEASFVKIKLQNFKYGLILTITDDGKGFDLLKKRTGIGITNMQSRAEHMGGKFKLDSKPGEGCRLQVKFPTLETACSKNSQAAS